MSGEKLYFEDLVVGSVETLGALPVIHEEVIDFARKFDPQGFHLDDAAAAASPFGRLAASGWQTGAMTMRLLVDHFLARAASLGGAGIEQLLWVKPVYPGDTLSLRLTLLDKRRSKSRPEMGLIWHLVETLNQHGEVVMSQKTTGMMAVRDPSAPVAG
jgi:acyl dehydratase